MSLAKLHVVEPLGWPHLVTGVRCRDWIQAYIDSDADGSFNSTEAGAGLAYFASNPDSAVSVLIDYEAGGAVAIRDEESGSVANMADTLAWFEANVALPAILYYMPPPSTNVGAPHTVLISDATIAYMKSLTSSAGLDAFGIDCYAHQPRSAVTPGGYDGPARQDHEITQAQKLCKPVVVWLWDFYHPNADVGSSPVPPWGFVKVSPADMKAAAKAALLRGCKVGWWGNWKYYHDTVPLWTAVTIAEAAALGYSNDLAGAQSFVEDQAQLIVQALEDAVAEVAMTTFSAPLLADTYLRSDQPTTNQNGANRLWCYRHSGVGALRPLMRFDITDLPEGATVTSALLDLYANTNNGAVDTELAFYLGFSDVDPPVPVAWLENEATWNVYSTGNNWSSAGGVYVPATEVLIANTAGTGHKFYQIASIVQAARDAGYTYVDVLLKWNNEAVAAEADIRYDDETQANPPTMEVIFTLAAGGVGGLLARHRGLTVPRFRGSIAIR